jgi:hypothetical protein
MFVTEHEGGPDDIAFLTLRKRKPRIAIALLLELGKTRVRAPLPLATPLAKFGD